MARTAALLLPRPCAMAVLLRRGLSPRTLAGRRQWTQPEPRRAPVLPWRRCSCADRASAPAAALLSAYPWRVLHLACAHSAATSVPRGQVQAASSFVAAPNRGLRTGAFHHQMRPAEAALDAPQRPRGGRRHAHTDRRRGSRSAAAATSSSSRGRASDDTVELDGRKKRSDMRCVRCLDALALRTTAELLGAASAPRRRSTAAVQAQRQCGLREPALLCVAADRLLRAAGRLRRAPAQRCGAVDGQLECLARGAEDMAEQRQAARARLARARCGAPRRHDGV
jgi:hypothetical protein